VKNLSEIKIDIGDSSSPVSTATATSVSVGGLPLIIAGGGVGGSASSPLQSPTSTRPIASPGNDMKSKEVVKFAAREVDSEGKEKINPKDLKHLQCPQVDDVDAGDPWERHWKLECEYEMLPLTQVIYRHWWCYLRPYLDMVFMSSLLCHLIGSIY
jgi:hypothetical protein